MREKTHIETERLVLRELDEGDFESLYAVLADSDIMRHYPYTFDEKRVRGWINKNIERYEIFGFGLFAVTLRESGEMIGDCGVTMQNIDGVICPEIGYHIRHDMQRMGYAREAARAVRDFVFVNTPFCKLFSYMKKSNIASSKTAMSIGMKFERDFTDNESEITSVYAVTRDDWEKMKNKR